MSWVPASQPTPQRVTVTREHWATYARWAGGVLVLIGLLFFYLHPSTTYRGYTSSGNVGTVSATCISPWNKWTEHYYPNTASTAAGDADAVLVTAACDQSIAAREHLGWTAVGVGILVVLGSFLPFGLRRATVT